MIGNLTMPELIHHQDPVTDLQQVFDAVFRLVVPGPGREMVGIQGISETLRGAPGWYLWFEGRPGAYLMELVEAETVPAVDAAPDTGRSEVRGTYWIKYYPATDDPNSLSAFSEIERSIRRGEGFDATGTPDFEKGYDIPAACFLVGMLEATLSADGETFSLCLESLDRWITTTPDPGLIGQEGKGARDRNVPAWDHAWFLVDRLILALCLGYRTLPQRVSLYEGPGHIFQVDGEGMFHALPDATVHERRLEASFIICEGNGHPCAGGHTHPNPEAADRADRQEASPYRLLFSCQGEPLTVHPWVSSSWWRIREGHAALGGALPC